MSKISFSKLNAKVNNSVQILNYQGQNIEVKQYLPIKEKGIIAQDIVSACIEKHDSYYNPIELEILEVIYFVLYYTNISFTDKQRQDYEKMYDLLVSSGLAKQIISLIPNDEINTLIGLIENSLKNIYQFMNSAKGILETVDMNQNGGINVLQTLKEQLADVEGLETLGSIMKNLG